MIHHYTSIETLALILRHRKIRFNRLDNVDDLSEAQYYGDYKLGKFLYVSCWTRSEEESIPMWHIYTPGMRGVRISFPEDWTHYRRLEPDSRFHLTTHGDIYAPVNFDELINDSYFMLPTFLGPGPFGKDVRYVENPGTYLRNMIITQKLPDGKLELKIEQTTELATYKHKRWAFEQEVRFVLLILPSLPIPPGGLGEQQYVSQLPDYILQALVAGEGPDIEHFDMDVRPDVIDNINVRLGPLCTEGDVTIVDSLLRTFTQNGRFTRSSLTGTIRRKHG